MKEFVAGFTKELLEAHHIVTLAKDGLVRRWPVANDLCTEDYIAEYRAEFQATVEELLCGKYPGVTIAVEVLPHVAGVYLMAPSWKPPHRTLKKFVVINKETT